MPPIDPNLPASDSDTIVAPSTPSGRSATGVVRLSGSRAEEIARLLVRCNSLAPRAATLGAMVDSAGAEVDQVLATFYPGPASYTGEDVVEVSCHGSPPVLRFAIERALELGARLAAPGEFTRRAFRNGRMDLVQAEGVRDLIDRHDPVPSQGGSAPDHRRAFPESCAVSSRGLSSSSRCLKRVSISPKTTSTSREGTRS